MDRNGALDDIDHRIIRALRDRPRLKNRALAEAMGLSEPTIYARLRQLAAAGVCEVRAQLDFAALGYRCTAFIDVWVDEDRVQEVAAIIAGIDEALFVTSFDEGARIMAVIVAVDDQAATRLIEDRLGALDHVSRLVIHIALRMHRYAWGYATIDADRHDPLPAPDNCPIDHSDRLILETLRLHPRYSNRQLAAKVGVSEATVRRRLAGLQEAGAYISTLVCEPRHLGYHAWREVRLVVPPAMLKPLAKALVAMPETLSVTHTTGAWNMRWFNLVQDDAEIEARLRPFDPAGEMRRTIRVRSLACVIKYNCDYVRILP